MAARHYFRQAKVIAALIPSGLVSLLDSLRFRTRGLQESVVVKPMARSVVRLPDAVTQVLGL